MEKYQRRHPTKSNRMMEERNIGFEFVRPIERDARLIMQWRNDPDTLRVSMHTQPKVWQTFYPEFLNSYFLFSDLPPLFILLNGERVAFVRLDPIEHPEKITERRCVEISINVAPSFRNQGIGIATLKIVKEWIKKRGYDDLYAKIKIDNKASQKAFLAAGFKPLTDELFVVEDTGEKVAVHRYIARLTQPIHNSTFIIAEAGSNWRMGSTKKDLEAAKKLIEVAAEAGANAIKFQVFRPDTIYVPNAGSSGYLSSAGIEKEMQEIFTDLAMPYDMIPTLAAHAEKNGIEFMATPFSKQDFLAIDPYVKKHKIASYEIGHIRLIELIAKTGKPTFMSTGAANESEIAWAVETFKKNQGGHLTLMQCTACYPANAHSLNLRSISWLQERFQCQVGLSDHSQEANTAPVAAVTLGATAIEKHFTLDSSLPGPDHAFALEPHALKSMVAAIRDTEKMLGSWVKTIHPSEMELRNFARRGLQAIQEIQKGDLLKEGVNIGILRPGNQPLGIHPKFLEQVEGKRATRHIPLGNGLQVNDYE